MLLKMKIPQILQVAADGIGHQASGCGGEIHAQPGGAVTDAPFGVLQLVIVQVKQQASVVVKLNRPILCGQYKKEACKG